eukprot:CAMPEP_0113470492 /NCGR_PEP_ID=MMETSP0014_2-20120614/16471_1 /TAXON_ID=2857 /ORGANISM="Nitzschia sp." /LENGTH=216 /DNA_ID=CAMNT_0000363059 /DNA_START=33 /DNA_END=683 /DNA_ORIENTATION=+ /assembly_acc=CAM_ASM_000159
MTNSYRNDDGGDPDKTSADYYMTYKNSDQVREFYLKKDYQKPGGKSAVSDDNHATTSSNNNTTATASSSSSSSSSKSSPSTSNSTTTLPDFWTDRQKERDLQAKQMGVFSRDAQQQQKQQQANTIDPSQHNSNSMRTNEKTEKEKGSVPTDPSSSPSSSSPSLSPEIALVQIATQTLETMVKAFQNKQDVKIPISERTAFANAMKQAMDVLAKQSM